ncbi:hypothetical protein [Hungatella hathewayi]|uniref:hypothetical protein n=1 Tax=Hungatella hathewayi TaxID=154046 RepID=UPI00033598A8|nr:hypothetical protein [Hungatella hathewayi]CCZ60023.1 uncharacterized protein BN544_02872 [Hungatella hathewayi CAG:224]
MKWIIGAGRDIIQNEEQLIARNRYIKKVMKAEVSPWKYIQIKGIPHGFYVCISEEEIDGTFITAHIGDIIVLSSINSIADSEFVVANTCIWTQLADKEVLSKLMLINPDIKLWFAKQELSIEYGNQLRQTNLISDVGNFGFPTSRSERVLYANRKKKFKDALSEAFELISPVLLPKDYGGMGWETLLKS